MGFSGFRQSPDCMPFACLIAAVPLPYYGAISTKSAVTSQAVLGGSCMAIEKAIEKVGVVGCGLMGSGIAQVAAQAGCQVTVREVSQQLLDKGLSRHRQKSRPPGREGNSHRRRPRSNSRPPARHHKRRRPERQRRDHRSHHRAVARKARTLGRSRQNLPEANNFREQHVVTLHHRNGHLHPAPRSLRRHALLQSRAGDEAGRSDSHHRHGSKSIRRNGRLRPAPRQNGRCAHPTAPASS